MNRKTLTVLILTLSLLAGSAAAQVNSVPLQPTGYYGSITVNGQPASPGTTITANIVNANIANANRGSITTTASGSYGGPAGPDPKLWVSGFQGENGSTVTFYVQGVAAKETTTWISGDIKRVDLSFVIPTIPSGVGGPSGGSGGGGGGDSITPKATIQPTPTPVVTLTPTPAVSLTPPPSITTPPTPQPSGGIPVWVYVLIAIVIIAVAAYFLMVQKKGPEKKK